MESVIGDFYTGQTIFITGATGFLGKVLIEKLLRTCSGVNVIYALMRPKKGRSVEERLENFFDAALFDKLRIENPNAMKKLKAISGDMIEDNLGISDEDMQLLINETTIVIHSAATIRFDEALRLSLLLNVKGMQKVVALCKKLTSLKVLVHVSTAFANCDNRYIEEKVYPPPVEPQKLLDALDWLNDDASTEITPVLIGKKPNTYTYTKHLAENLLIKEAEGLPYIIVRPSIVGASWKDPLPGWIDNFNGPSGLFIACGLGIMRSMIGNPDAIADIVPVDIAVNVIIASAWYKVVQLENSPSDFIPILHSCSGNENPLYWCNLFCLLDVFRRQMPYQNAYRYPNCAWTQSRALHFLWVCMCHKVPAFLVDLYMRAIGRKPRMMEMYDRLHKNIDILAFFTQRTWKWERNTIVHLQESLQGSDKETFNTSVANLNWDNYLLNFIGGTKRFILNEEMSQIDVARQRMTKLKTLHYIFNTFTFVVLWRLMINRSEFASNIWASFLGFFTKWLKYFSQNRFITL